MDKRNGTSLYIITYIYHIYCNFTLLHNTLSNYALLSILRNVSVATTTIVAELSPLILDLPLQCL